MVPRISKPRVLKRNAAPSEWKRRKRIMIEEPVLERLGPWPKVAGIALLAVLLALAKRHRSEGSDRI
jgi:hypothetical protein